MLGVLLGILALSLMMWLHELGHYLAGKRLGFKIREFNIFMGPVLFSYRKNGVRYALRAIPIGASVLFAGEDADRSEEGDEARSGDGARGEDGAGAEGAAERITSDWGRANARPISGEDDPRLFPRRPKRQRAAVLLAGPLMNILSGFVVLLILFNSFGYTSTELARVRPGTQAAEAGLAAGDTLLSLNGQPVDNLLDLNFAYMFIEEQSAVRVEVRKADGALSELLLQPREYKKKMLGILRDSSGDSLRVSQVSAEQNGGNPVLEVGDLILEVDGRAATTDNFSALLESAQGERVRLRLLRAGREIEVESLVFEGKAYTPLGMEFASKRDFLSSIPYTGKFVFSFVRSTFASIGKIFAGALKPSEAIGGPVAIVSSFSEVVGKAQESWGEKLFRLGQLFALVSLSLGVMNLLPIPLLDGSHLLLLLIEGIRGKALSERAQGVVALIGLTIILGLFALGLYYDVLRLIGR